MKYVECLEVVCHASKIEAVLAICPWLSKQSETGGFAVLTTQEEAEGYWDAQIPQLLLLGSEGTIRQWGKRRRLDDPTITYQPIPDRKTLPPGTEFHSTSAEFHRHG